jgi:ribonuclease HI
LTFNPLEHKNLPEEWYIRPPTIDQIPEGVFVVIADAAYDDRIAGVSAIIRRSGAEYTPKNDSAVCEGPNHAELASVKLGLRKICEIKKEKKRVVVYNDSQWGNQLLNGLATPELEHIKTVHQEIGELSKKVGCQIDYLWVRGKMMKRVDKLANKAKKAKEQAKEKEIEKRKAKVARASDRGSKIKILEKNRHTYAVSGSEAGKLYKVTLRPPSCECPGWKNRYGKLEVKAVQARALPCKHMGALAKYAGIDIAFEFRRQILRRD